MNIDHKDVFGQEEILKDAFGGQDHNIWRSQTPEHVYFTPICTILMLNYILEMLNS